MRAPSPSLAACAPAPPTRASARAYVGLVLVPVQLPHLLPLQGGLEQVGNLLQPGNIVDVQAQLGVQRAHESLKLPRVGIHLALLQRLVAGSICAGAAAAHFGVVPRSVPTFITRINFGHERKNLGRGSLSTAITLHPLDAMTRSSVSSSFTNAAQPGRKRAMTGRRGGRRAVPPTELRSLHAELRSLRAAVRALKAQQAATATALKKLEHLVNVSIAHF